MGDTQGNSRSTAVADTSAATLTVSDGRTTVSVLAEASGGAMTVTVEVSDDGSNWHERTAVFSSDVQAGNSVAESFETGCNHVRASGGANVGRVAVATKGL
jgi:hypothetical protein